MASRRTFSSEFKARVVHEALKERETTSELAPALKWLLVKSFNGRKKLFVNFNLYLVVNILAKKAPPKMNRSVFSNKK